MAARKGALMNLASRLPISLLLVVVALGIASSCGSNSDKGDGQESTEATLSASGTLADEPETPSPSPSPSPTTSPDPHAEDDLARSLLLTVNDLPTGWSETPPDDEEKNPFDECDRGSPPGATGEAETNNFSRGGAAAFSEDVVVFAAQADAVSSLDRIQGLADCLVALINDGKLDTDEAEFSDAKFGAMSFPSFGDVTDAYRLEFHVKAKGQSGLGSEGTAYLDMVRVVEGRLGAAIKASDVFSPFDTAMLESTVTKAHQKLARAEQ